MRLRRSWIRAIRVSAALAALYASGELAALKAAGFTGQVPVGGKVIKSLVGTLQSNWEWLIASGVSLVLVVAGLMMFGSQRAPDHLFRVIAGVLMILVVIPAVLA